MRLAQEIIRRKRDGATLAADEIADFIQGVTDRGVSDAQIAALTMAVMWRGLSAGEVVALTRSMAHSGVTLDWSGMNLPGPVLDKHSSGGVGDAVSLILAPAIAACGGFVPMLSGRGLGHTGGTLDKVAAIPGYVATPDLATLRQVVRDIGCAVVGATAELAPADRRMYAVRDVTATVESVPLITASILSKKLAEGLDGLVMDVKFGSGAFMPTLARARELAESLVTVATGADLPITALLTDMNAVLGGVAGNALEVRAVIAALTGGPFEARLRTVTGALVAEALTLGGIAANPDQGLALFDAALASGAVAERFARMVAALGGPADILERPDFHLAKAPIVEPLFAPNSGVVAAINVQSVGLAVVELGGGRRVVEDVIDPAVGLTDVVGVGRPVGPDDRPLCVIHARDEAGLSAARARLLAAFTIADTAPLATSPIAARIVG